MGSFLPWSFEKFRPFRGALGILVPAAFALAFGLPVLYLLVKSTSNEADAWQAIESLATAGTLFVTLLAAGALGLAAREFEARAQDTRAARMPYLRIDLGFHPDDAIQPGFFPPPARFMFKPAHFGMAPPEVPEALRPGPAPNDGVRRLVLWVTNLQEQPLAIAFNIKCRAVLAWGDELGENEKYEVEFVYVAPGSTTAIELFSVRRDLIQFHAAVTEVLYGDMEVLARRYIDHHGATGLTYDRNRGMHHGRSFQLGPRKEKEQRN